MLLSATLVRNNQPSCIRTPKQKSSMKKLWSQCLSKRP